MHCRKSTLAMLVILAAAAASAAAAEPFAELKPGDLYDSGFLEYVDLSLLGKAWNEQDAALLTDVALQLAEGERILLRPHKAVSADQLFAVSARLARENGDAETLARLVRAVEGRDAALFAAVKAQHQLGSATRGGEQAPRVDLKEFTPTQFALFKFYVDEMQAAKVSHDVEAMNALEKLAEEDDQLPQPAIDRVKKLLAEARKSVPEQTKPADERCRRLLAVLGQASRYDPFGDGGGFDLEDLNPSGGSPGVSYPKIDIHDVGREGRQAAKTTGTVLGGVGKAFASGGGSGNQGTGGGQGFIGDSRDDRITESEHQEGNVWKREDGTYIYDEDEEAWVHEDDYEGKAGNPQEVAGAFLNTGQNRQGHHNNRYPQQRRQSQNRYGGSYQRHSSNQGWNQRQPSSQQIWNQQQAQRTQRRQAVQQRNTQTIMRVGQELLKQGQSTENALRQQRLNRLQQLQNQYQQNQMQFQQQMQQFQQPSYGGYGGGYGRSPW